RQRGSQCEHPGALDRHEGSLPGAVRPARRAPPFPVAPDGLHCRRGPVPRRRCARRHASPAKIRRNRQADSGEPAALHRTGRKKKAVSPDLHRISAAADGRGAVRLDLARAPAFEVGQPSRGGAGRRYGGDLRATDELAELVQSFNSMAEQLESSRRQIEASNRDVSAANEALESRRRYIETVLESIPTGVISIDAARRVTLANAAF